MRQLALQQPDLLARDCEACGSTSLRVLLNSLSHKYSKDGHPREWQYRLLECENCGLGFVDPKPTWDLLQTFYDTHYGNFDGSKADPRRDAYSFKYRIAKMRTAGTSAGKLRSRLDPCLGALVEWTTGRTIPYTLSVPLQLQSQAHIFDLGYGSGHWLLAMSELGYQNLYGYDIAANTQNAARLRERGVSVTSGVFLENEYPLESFDCVRLDHVFEHLVEPVEVLQKCYSMLRPGGFLVMSFPCKNSWSMKLSLTDSPALQVPKHLYHHTQLSSRLLLESTGFTPLKIRAYSVASQLAGTVNKILGDRNSATIPPLLFEMLSPPYRLFGTITGKGDFMTVWAQKGTPTTR